jgi:hypothetical protein
MNKMVCGYSKDSRNIYTLLRWSFLFLLLVGTIYQGYLFLGDATKEITRVWKAIGGSRLWRSAYFSQNKRFADYVIFLNEIIPQNAKVVLPPEGIGPRLLGHVPYMQYFLMPREVINCSDGDTACLQRFSDNGAYIVIADSDFFPGSNPSLNANRLRMFDTDWGVFIPQGMQAGSTPIKSGFSSLTEVIKGLIYPGLWLVLLSLPGWILVRRILTFHSELTTAFVGVCLALGLFSFILYLCLLVNQFLSKGLLVIAMIVWWSLALLIWRRLPGPQRLSSHFHLDPWHIIFLSLVAVNAILAVGKSYFASDELIIWANKGYAIAEVGLKGGISKWGLSSWKYTLNIPILIAAFQEGSGDLLPASKLIFPLYYGATIVGIYSFLKRYVSQNTAGLATLAFSTTPLILHHATIGYANLPYAACFTLATTIALEELLENKPEYSIPRLLLAGVLFALGAWSRLEGIVVGLFFEIVLGFWYWRMKGRSWLSATFWLASPLVFLGLIWFSTSSLAYILPRSKSGVVNLALTQMLQGNFHLVELLYALRWLILSLSNFATWGVIGFAVLLVSWFPLKRDWRNPIRSVLFLCGGAVLITGLGTVYAASYSTGCDVSCWVSTGLDRYVLLGVALLYVESVRRALEKAVR